MLEVYEPWMSTRIPAAGGNELEVIFAHRADCTSSLGFSLKHPDSKACSKSGSRPTSLRNGVPSSGQTVLADTRQIIICCNDLHIMTGERKKVPLVE